MSNLTTRLGLPLLRQETYDGLMRKVRNFDSYKKGVQFIKDLFDEIREKDPLYGKFIADTTNMWPITERDIVLADLATGYELLNREGQLPVLEEEKFKARWDATMDRVLAPFNVGVNMSLIEGDNPIFSQFIQNSSLPYQFSQRMNIISDLSSGYMFLVDSVKR